jgi:hypothetical protein
MKMLETIRAANLAQSQTSEAAWLVEGLWSAQAVGLSESVHRAPPGHGI